MVFQYPLMVFFLFVIRFLKYKTWLFTSGYSSFGMSNNSDYCLCMYIYELRCRCSDIRHCKFTCFLKFPNLINGLFITNLDKILTSNFSRKILYESSESSYLLIINRNHLNHLTFINIRNNFRIHWIPIHYYSYNGCINF